MEILIPVHLASLISASFSTHHHVLFHINASPIDPLYLHNPEPFQTVQNTCTISLLITINCTESFHSRNIVASEGKLASWIWKHDSKHMYIKSWVIRKYIVVWNSGSIFKSSFAKFWVHAYHVNNLNLWNMFEGAGFNWTLHVHVNVFMNHIDS